MKPEDRLFGTQTRTWGLQTEWCYTAIDALARFQYSVEQYREEGEAIRQITGLDTRRSTSTAPSVTGTSA